LGSWYAEVGGPLALWRAWATNVSGAPLDAGRVLNERPAANPALDVVIEMELVRMRAQPDGIDLLVPLVAEPGFDHVLGENIAAQQKGVIGFERIKVLRSEQHNSETQ